MNKKRGIVGTIVLIIVAIILLGYFQISLKKVIGTPTVQDNLLYAWQLLEMGVINVFHLLTSTISTFIVNRGH